MFAIVLNYVTVWRIHENNDGYGHYYQDLDLNQTTKTKVFKNNNDAKRWIIEELLTNYNKYYDKKAIIPYKFRGSSYNDFDLDEFISELNRHWTEYCGIDEKNYYPFKHYNIHAFPIEL